MRLWFLVLLALGVILTLGALAAAGVLGTTARGLPAADIVFTRHVAKSHRDDLYVVAADGSHLRLLVRNAAGAAVSPAGRRIAFVRGHRIWIMQRDGSHQRQVTDTIAQSAGKGQLPAVVDSEPAWSPTGRTLYFSRWVRVPEGGSEIYSIRDNGTRLVYLTGASPGQRYYSAGDPSPSPDGRVIAFSKIDGGHWINGRIYAASAAGRPERLPFDFPDNSEYDLSLEPAWSPDGRQLAYWFFDYQPAAYGLYVSRADGSRPRRIAVPSGEQRHSAWSPDGEWIAFGSRHGVSLVRTDGTSPRALTRGGFDPAWLPLD